MNFILHTFHELLRSILFTLRLVGVMLAFGSFAIITNEPVFLYIGLFYMIGNIYFSTWDVYMDYARKKKYVQGTKSE